MRSEWEVPARPGNSNSSSSGTSLARQPQARAFQSWSCQLGSCALASGCWLCCSAYGSHLADDVQAEAGEEVLHLHRLPRLRGRRSRTGRQPFRSRKLSGLRQLSALHQLPHPHAAQQVTVLVTGSAAAGKLGPMHWQFSTLHRICPWQAASHRVSAPAPPCPAAPRRAARSRQTCRAWQPDTSCAGQAGWPCRAEAKCPGGQAAITHSRLSGTASTLRQSERPPTRPAEPATCSQQCS